MNVLLLDSERGWVSLENLLPVRGLLATSFYICYSFTTDEMFYNYDDL